jgi:hypothetical protein
MWCGHPSLTTNQIEGLSPGLSTGGLGGREAPASVAAVAGLRDPHFEHDPACLPQVSQHVHAESRHGRNGVGLDGRRYFRPGAVGTGPHR